MTVGCITNSTSHQAVFLNQHALLPLKSKISLMFSFFKEHTLLPLEMTLLPLLGLSLDSYCPKWWMNSTPSIPFLSSSPAVLDRLANLFWHVGFSETHHWLLLSFARVKLLPLLAWSQPYSPFLHFSLAFLISLQTQFLQKVPVPLWASCRQHVAAHSTACVRSVVLPRCTFCSSAELHSIKELCSQSSHKEQVTT